MKEGDVVFFENVRFYKEEEENDREFVKVLVLFVDIYVNDVFGIVYRVYVLIVGVVEFLFVVVGFLMEKEIEMFGNVFVNL